MSSQFSALLLAGGRSTRMGTDKAFVEIDGVPLWRRQLQIIEELQPHELFIAGPAHEEWQQINCIIIPDAEPDSGPLGGIVEALQRCAAPLLLVVAVDLPNITTRYLRCLLNSCAGGRGVIPTHGEQCEPLTTVYPKGSLPLAEKCLASRNLSVQRFASHCVTEGFAVQKEITDEERRLFFNMNTPYDLALVSTDV